MKIPLIFSRHLHGNAKGGIGKIRNVGIMAHIDAGKTTVTERMLYYSGLVNKMGEVHKGDTVMDFMDQERRRGITISSAAITIPWQDFRINLIDTPGHVDFTYEVERSLRALDGGVVLIDGSAGVEAQTMTVWRQASRNNVPCIAFINKLDKSNADLQMAVDSMARKLSREILLTQLPLISDSSVIDLIRMERLVFDGKEGQNVTKAKTEIPKAVDARKVLVEQLSEIDDDIAEAVVAEGSYDQISPDLIEKALTRAVKESTKCLVTFCGSAYKNIGVQPLMNAIVKYLPNPKDKVNRILVGKGLNQNDLCATAFKTIHHPTKGVLTFTRLYTGHLKEGESFSNLTRETSEKATKLYYAYADDYKPTTEANAGDIVVISGLKEAVTGDTLAKGANKKSGKLAGIELPDPVFFCTIEPPSMGKQKQLDLALANLAREDPSLRVIQSDQDNDQTILQGMGELHLEVILERIRKEYKVDADLGPLMVAYKETPLTNFAEASIKFERKISNVNHSVEIGISVIKDLEETKPTFKLSKKKEHAEDLENVRPWQIKAMDKGFANAVSTGPLLGYPVINASFEITKAIIGPGTKDTMISSAIVQAVRKVMEESETSLMEPYMRLTIHAEPEVVSTLVQDVITRRRGEIESREEAKSEMHVITATAPLSELRGYSTHLRTITSGRAFYGLEFSHYSVMDSTSQKKAIQEVTGF